MSDKKMPGEFGWTVCKLLLIVLLTVLAGCGSQDEQINNEVNAEAEYEVDDAGVDSVIMTFQTLEYSRMEDLDMVIDAVNEISIPRIGVKLEVKMVDATDAFTEYPLWLSRKETVDLMMLNYQDITTYIGKDMIIPLDGLLEKYGSDLTALIQEGMELTEGSVMKGEAYGISIISLTQGSGGGIWIPERYLEEVGYHYSRTHIYSLDELTVLFGRLKEKYPEMYPLGQITSENKYSTVSYYLGNMDSMGGDVTNGVLMPEDNLQVVNLFETQLYYDFLCHIRKWYLDGYIYPDAAITDASVGELIAGQIIMSQALSSQPGIAMEDEFGEEIVCLRTSEVQARIQNSKTGFWTIPATSKNPEAAMQFLNLMYADSRVSNLLQWGLEGKHYIILDEAEGIIALPQEADVSEIGYYNPLGLYGNRRELYTMDSKDQKREREIYNCETIPNDSPAKGFVYSTVNVDRKIDEVQRIVETYVPLLESGSVDLERYYPEFLEKLRIAGIDEIIEDKQRQFDEWLAGRSQ